MADEAPYTLFSDSRRLAHGDLSTIASAAHQALAAEGVSVLAFSDLTGRLVDLDLRGTRAEVAARYAAIVEPPPSKATRGRPKLGVVAREVTLLPRHWDWLMAQPGGASASLRRLVDQARRDHSGEDRRREAREATHRVMTAMAGDLSNYEEALRAFYAGEKGRFLDLTASWPKDVGDYVRLHASAAWADSD